MTETAQGRCFLVRDLVCLNKSLYSLKKVLIFAWNITLFFLEYRYNAPLTPDLHTLHTNWSSAILKKRKFTPNLVHWYCMSSSQVCASYLSVWAVSQCRYFYIPCSTWLTRCHFKHFAVKLLSCHCCAISGLLFNCLKLHRLCQTPDLKWPSKVDFISLFHSLYLSIKHTF